MHCIYLSSFAFKSKGISFFNNHLFYLGIIIILVQPILKKRYYVPRYRLRIISAPLKTKKFPSKYIDKVNGPCQENVNTVTGYKTMNN